MMTSGGKALTNELSKSFQNPPFLKKAIDRERGSCNKRFSLVRLGGCAEAMVISREFNVTGTSKLYFSLLDSMRVL